ncbi:PTS system mannose/fructose/sorbose family transporter subunit IID [Thermophilibacter provencensis]|nr:PTS system mannose/fructose/sorbose family transporter subunit IID [Thermophilibacter provencensis]
MTTMSSKTTGYKLTKADFQQINRRNLVGFQAGWNYERMQHSGYLWIILPQLRKIYGDNTEALKTACRTQCSPFFNTSNFLNTIITGIDLAIEETEGLEGMETVASLKTGLMGPLASIGDSIFGSLLPTIFGALAANMAMEGNPLGIFIWIAVNVVVDWFRCKQTYIAYDQGMKLVTTMSDQLNAITDAATVMGVFMVGALVSTNVGIVITAPIDLGGVTVDLQHIANVICPKLVPAALVGFVYWLLGKKGMTSTKAIFIVLILGIVLGALGWVAKG